MSAYIATRLVQMVPTLIALSVVVFLILRAIPGDATVSLMAESGRYDEEQLESIRSQWDLDKPLPVQYLSWMGNNLRGEFGFSFYSDQPVKEELFSRLPVTIELTALAVLLGASIGIPLGVLSAATRNSPIDLSLRSVSLTGLAVPEFWLGTLILVLPAVWWGWLPPLKYTPFMDDPAANLSKMLPAAAAMAVGTSAVLLRLVRSAMLESLSQDYIRTATAKGLSPFKVISRHALGNALIPVITVVGIQVAALIGGTVVVETIFNIPGVGQQTLRSLEFRDYPQLQFNILVIGVGVLIINLLVDIAYGLIDPRVRLGQ
jgi:peptide/nickel transport system permease protein